MLLALGIEQDQALAEQAAARSARAAKPVKGRQDRFAQHLEALRAFAAREGHVRVPRQHREPVPGPGGAKLAPEQRAALAEAGMEWA